MGWSALGDSAWLYVACAVDSATRLACVLELTEKLEAERIVGVQDIVSSYETLAVHFDPADGERIMEWLQSMPLPLGNVKSNNARIVEVPVDYSGAGEIAGMLGLAREEVISLHCSAHYTVAAVGFSPGFPYLTGLPERLHLPRKATPRRVPSGSVAIAGNQAGIYPFDSQGGWHVLGRTDLCLFDPLREPPALFKPGDHLRFVAVKFSNKECAVSISPVVAGGLEVIDAGVLTSVQDPGRPGYQNIGVSPGGAADHVAARVANRLVGNPDDAAVLECCMRGPRLRFHEDARVAWVGWADQQCGRPVNLTNGAELDLRGRMTALRGYIAIAGGIDVPLLLGSRSTDLRAGFGGSYGKALKLGDRLPVGEPQDGPRPGAWKVAWPSAEKTGILELRFLKGLQADWFSRDARDVFQNTLYQISPHSDRMGARLDGPSLVRERLDELVSQPVVAGSVQVPTDGRPIVLLADRQTIGGYPQIGHVISADLPKLARAWPGTRLRFREVTLDEARAAWAGLRRELAIQATGLDLLNGSS